MKKDKNQINEPEAKTVRQAIAIFKREEKEWLKNTFSASDLKKMLGLKKKEIEKLKAEEYRGETRYDKQYILGYLKERDRAK